MIKLTDIVWRFQETKKFSQDKMYDIVFKGTNIKVGEAIVTSSQGGTEVAKILSVYFLHRIPTVESMDLLSDHIFWKEYKYLYNLAMTRLIKKIENDTGE